MLTFESEQFQGASGIIEKLKVRRPATSWKSIISMNTECDPAYRHCRSKRSSTIFPPSTLSLRRLAKLVSLFWVGFMQQQQSHLTKLHTEFRMQ